MQTDHGTYQAWEYAIWAERRGIPVVPTREPDREEAWHVLSEFQQQLQLPAQTDFPNLVVVVLKSLLDRDVSNTVIKILTSKVVVYEVKQAKEVRTKITCLMMRLWTGKRLVQPLGDFSSDPLLITLWKLATILGATPLQQLLMAPVPGQLLLVLRQAWSQVPDKKAWLPWSTLVPLMGDYLHPLLQQGAQEGQVQMQAEWKSDPHVAAFVSETGSRSTVSLLLEGSQFRFPCQSTFVGGHLQPRNTSPSTSSKLRRRVSRQFPRLGAVSPSSLSRAHLRWCRRLSQQSRQPRLNHLSHPWPNRHPRLNHLSQRWPSRPHRQSQSPRRCRSTSRRRVSHRRQSRNQKPDPDGWPAQTVRTIVTTKSEVVLSSMRMPPLRRSRRPVLL